MNIIMAYFSATRNTARVAHVIKERLEQLGAAVDAKDITSLDDRRQPLDLTAYQAALFGAPIHSNRAPRIVREWLSTLDGNGLPCATFFTYGGFGVHPTHYSTRAILDSRGFDLVSSAEFLGKHTFNISGWSAMTERPNQSDFDVAREFADITFKRFTGEDPKRPGPFEKTNKSDRELDAMELMRFKAVTQLPTREGAACSLCMVCEELCPTRTMDANKGEVSDPTTCLVCLRCIDNCPEDALHINDLRQMWPVKLKMDNETEASLKQKKSRIYL
jgi:ferredoxin/flavodoxin